MNRMKNLNCLERKVESGLDVNGKREKNKKQRNTEEAGEDNLCLAGQLVLQRVSEMAFSLCPETFCAMHFLTTPYSSELQALKLSTLGTLLDAMVCVVCTLEKRKPGVSCIKKCYMSPLQVMKVWSFISLGFFIL